MFGKNYKKEKYAESSLKDGTIPRQLSYIMAVPHCEQDMENLNNILERLKSSSLFETQSITMDDNTSALHMTAKYKNMTYEMRILPETLELPPLYTIQHQFREEDFKAMEAAKQGVTVEMTFGENSLDSFHLQIKVLYCIFPNLLGLVDFSAERILSGVWARMSAESSVPPAPSYLYSGQAVSGDGDNVWLHTHGLNRCGSIEIEILGSDREHYSDHYNVLQTIAGNIVSKEKLEKEREAFWIGNLNGGAPIVGTWLNWENAVKLYSPELPGGRGDRGESHNIYTGCVFLYLSPADMKKKKPSPVTALNDALKDNPLMMISNEETDRMSALARERFSWFEAELQKPDVHGLIKFGMKTDDEFRKENQSEHEHLWFEAKEIMDGGVRCIATQEPYYIKSLHEGQEVTILLEHLTDWILYTPENQITPDSVYLLVQEA